MFKKFQPTLDTLEARTVPSAAPVSPLTDVAVNYAAAAVKGYASVLAVIEQSIVKAEETRTQLCFSTATINALATAEKQLDNTMQLMEQYESYYKAMGYNDAYFKYYDTVFHNYDNAVWSFLTLMEADSCNNM